MVPSSESLEWQTLRYLGQEGLPLPNDGHPLLLAVSGGVDSTVMAYLMWRLGFSISLAHGNFQLRGEAAEADQAHVEALARSLNVHCHVQRFETRQHAKQAGISLEMAARDLRYNWFRTLMEAQGYAYLATAHHLNDQAETLLLNLTKGTGIKGLTAIQPLNGYTMRPLLFATKDQLIRYAQENQLAWREDESNQYGTHERNHIRHQVIPALKSLNPSFEHTISEDIQHFREIYQVWEQQYRARWEQLANAKGHFLYLSKAGLASLSPVNPYLHAFFSPFGFNKAQIRQVAASMAHQPGALFYAPTYQLEVARHFLILAPNPLPNPHLTFQSPNSEAESHGHALSMRVEHPSKVSLSAPDYVCLDADTLTFPLKLRPWQAGDRFYPLGMKQPKKLSDFFTDNHWARLEKAQALVLETAKGEIAWIAQSRPDDRFKVTHRTQRVLKLHYQQPG